MNVDTLRGIAAVFAVSSVVLSGVVGYETFSMQKLTGIHTYVVGVSGDACYHGYIQAGMGFGYQRAPPYCGLQDLPQTYHSRDFQLLFVRDGANGTLQVRLDIDNAYCRIETMQQWDGSVSLSSDSGIC